MPQAAFNALAGYFFSTTALSAAASIFLANFIQVFAYSAAINLLNRAARSLAPKPKSAGLGGANPSHYYDGGAHD